MSAAPKDLAGPIIGRQFAVPAFDSAASGTIAFASSLVPVLAIVLHGAVAKVNEPFFPALAGLDHHLFTGPGAFTRHVAGHGGFFTDWHDYPLKKPGD